MMRCDELEGENKKEHRKAKKKHEDIHHSTIFDAL